MKEHASYPYPLDRDPSVREGVIDAFRRNGVVIVPTLVAWQTQLMDRDSLLALARDSLGDGDPRRRLVSAFLVREWEIDLEDRKRKSAESLREWSRFFDTMSADLNAMHQGGVRMLPGSDLATAGVFPGFSIHAELEMLVHRVGLTPMEAIESATRWPAELFGESDELGTIEPGKRADFLLLDANPVEDIANSRRITGVVIGGRYLDEVRVRELLGAPSSPADAPPAGGQDIPG